MLNRLLKNTGGFTVGFSFPSRGFAFSPYSERELKIDHVPTYDEIWEYVEKNKDLLLKEGHYLGAWKDNGDTYLDISVVSDKLDKAISLAKYANQKALFSLETGKTIYLDGRKDS